MILLDDAAVADTITAGVPISDARIVTVVAHAVVPLGVVHLSDGDVSGSRIFTQRVYRSPPGSHDTANRYRGSKSPSGAI